MAYSYRAFLLSLFINLLVTIVLYLHTWHPRFLSYLEHHVPGLFRKLATMFPTIPFEQWLNSHAKQIGDMPVDLETLVPAHWEFRRICLFVLYHFASAERRYQEAFEIVTREYGREFSISDDEGVPQDWEAESRSSAGNSSFRGRSQHPTSDTANSIISSSSRRVSSSTVISTRVSRCTADLRAVRSYCFARLVELLQVDFNMAALHANPSISILDESINILRYEVIGDGGFKWELEDDDFLTSVPADNTFISPDRPTTLSTTMYQTVILLVFRRFVVLVHSCVEIWNINILFRTVRPLFLFILKWGFITWLLLWILVWIDGIFKEMFIDILNSVPIIGPWVIFLAGWGKWDSLSASIPLLADIFINIFKAASFSVTSRLDFFPTLFPPRPVPSTAIIKSYRPIHLALSSVLTSGWSFTHSHFNTSMHLLPIQDMLQQSSYSLTRAYLAWSGSEYVNSTDLSRAMFSTKRKTDRLRDCMAEYERGAATFLNSWERDVTILTERIELFAQDFGSVVSWDVHIRTLVPILFSMLTAAGVWLIFREGRYFFRSSQEQLQQPHRRLRYIILFFFGFVLTKNLSCLLYDAYTSPIHPNCYPAVLFARSKFSYRTTREISTTYNEAFETLKFDLDVFVNRTEFRINHIIHVIGECQVSVRSVGDGYSEINHRWEATDRELQAAIADLETEGDEPIAFWNRKPKSTLRSHQKELRNLHYLGQSLRRVELWVMFAGSQFHTAGDWVRAMQFDNNALRDTLASFTDNLGAYTSKAKRKMADGQLPVDTVFAVERRATLIYRDFIVPIAKRVAELRAFAKNTTSMMESVMSERQKFVAQSRKIRGACEATELGGGGVMRNRDRDRDMEGDRDGDEEDKDEVVEDRNMRVANCIEEGTRGMA